MHGKNTTECKMMFAISEYVIKNSSIVLTLLFGSIPVSTAGYMMYFPCPPFSANGGLHSAVSRSW